jgi:hypothetical protein
VVELATGRSTPVANYDDADVGEFEWVNDERLVYSLEDRRNAIGQQRFFTGLFSVMADGSDPRQLIALQRDIVFVRRVGREPLSVFHELLSVPSTGGQRGWWSAAGVTTAGTNPVEVTPMLLDTSTQRIRSLDIGGLGDVLGWLFDRKGEPRLATTLSGGTMQYHWRTPGETTWKKIAEFPPPGRTVHAAFRRHGWPAVRQHAIGCGRRVRVAALRLRHRQAAGAGAGAHRRASTSMAGCSPIRRAAAPSVCDCAPMPRRRCGSIRR